MDEQDGKLRYERNSETRSHNNFCCGKAIRVTYFDCLSIALVIVHAKLMGRIILSCVTCLDLHYSFTLSHQRHDLGK